MKRTAVLAIVLVAACGPSPEAVECCECLRGTTPLPTEIVQADDGTWEAAGIADIGADACPVALEEARVWTAQNRWQPGVPDEYDRYRGVCAEACAAHVDELELAHGRL